MLSPNWKLGVAEAEGIRVSTNNLTQWFSSRGHMAASGKNFGCHTGWELLLASVDRGQGGVEHSTVQRTALKSAVLRLRNAETMAKS